ncbi:MAG: hypothetical protein AMXMBFR7_29350 [Planctomycetota bacterium]
MLLLCACGLCAGTLRAGEAAPPDPKAAAFEALLLKAAQGLTDAEMAEILKAGAELGRAREASNAFKTYMTKQPEPAEELMRQAAELAFLSADYQTAVSRFKAYLKEAKPDAKSSEAAGRLYDLLVGFVPNEDAAFQFMATQGLPFRQHVYARKFDSWFLEAAQRRNDLRNYARKLVSIYADPASHASRYFDGHIDWICARLAEDQERRRDAADDLRKLLPSIKNEKRNATLAFYTACLEQMNWDGGVDKPLTPEAWNKLRAAAEARMKSDPTFDALSQTVCAFFKGNRHFDERVYRNHAKDIQGLFAAVFPLLPKPEQTKFMTWQIHGRRMADYAAPVQQWLAWAEKDLEFYKQSGPSQVFLSFARPENADLFKKLAPFVGTHAQAPAAATRSLAVDGDLLAAAKNLYTTESWHLSLHEPTQILHQHVAPAFLGYKREKGQELPPQYWEKTRLKIGAELIAPSPIALFDQGGAQDFARLAWQFGSKDGEANHDKSKTAALLKLLAWVPYDAAARKAIFDGPYKEFRDWKKQFEKDGAGVAKEQQAALKAQLAEIDQVYQDLQSGKAQGTPPTPLCQQLATAVQSARAKQKDAYLKVAREIFDAHKDYNVSHKPFGKALVAWQVQTAIQAFNDYEYAGELLKDQLALLPDESARARAAQLCAWIASAEKEWQGGNQITKKDMEHAIKLAGIIDQAYAPHAQQGKYWGDLYHWMRMFKRGQGWRDQDAGAATLAGLIEKRVWFENPPKFDWWIQSGTAAAMHQVREEFQGLKAKYPLESGFDAMFLEEAEKTGHLDFRYWHMGGHDREKKIRNYAAQKMAEWEHYPSGYDWESMWEWQRRLLEADPQIREATLAKTETYWGKTRFDWFAMGWGRFACGWGNDEQRATRFQQLAQYLDRAAETPQRILAPRLDPLGHFFNTRTPPKPEELDVLLKFFPLGCPQQWYGGWGFEYLITCTLDGLSKQNRLNELPAVAPYLWLIARDTNNGQFHRVLSDFAVDLYKKEQYHLALTVAAAGLEILGDRMDKEAATALTTVRTQTLAKVGGGISVSRNDPNYPFFAAQEQYQTSNFTAAWDQYSRNAAKASGVIKQLEPSFALWLIRRHTDLQQFDMAEQLSRVLLQHMESAPAGFEAEHRAALQVAYADIAFARKEYPRARAQYEEIAVNKSYQGTQSQMDAHLRVAEVDRLTKQYDKAMEQLEKMAESKERYLQTQALYQIARVKFDQGQQNEAEEALNQVLLRSPDHADAKLLMKEVLIAQKKYEAALLIAPGQLRNQQLLVPGAPLKVSLEDRNLAVVGKSLAVEVQVVTSAGDKETFNLLPAGESKTQFQGQIPTQLGAPAPGDHTLQVLGNDTISYDYSEDFKKRLRISLGEPAALKIASDAEMYASSGKILTKEELEAHALEQMIRQRLNPRGEEEGGEGVALSSRRDANQVKPGNAINVRIVDLERSTTAEADEIAVEVTTSSGDRIDAFKLKESGPTTGVFEGAIPTAAAQATAYASDSDEGRIPDYVISKEQYPPWRALPDNKRPKAFMVDLADNLPLGRMTLTAKDDARKLKAFSVEVSQNGRQFETVGSWPQALKPWNGTPRITVAKSGPNPPRNLEQFREFFNRGFIAQGSPKRTMDLPLQNRKTLSGRLDGNVFDLRNALRLDHNDLYVVHLSAAFQQKERKARTFKFVFENPGQHAYAVLALDGQEGSEPGVVSRALKEGVHRVDIYFYCRVHHGTHFELQQDIEAEPFIAGCPLEMFGADKNPAVKEEVQRPVAQVTADGPGTAFEIAFPSDVRARVVRLLLEDFASDAPALDKITLTSADGTQVLPPKEDFQALRVNQQLEIVPGDRITITYKDPIRISESKGVHSASLSATYHDAKLSAVQVVEKVVAGREEPLRDYVPIRRYKADDNVTVFVNDPDGDVSGEKDTITIKASTTSGKQIEVKALESEAHSGIFLGRIFPVPGAPQRPVEIQVGQDEDLVLSYLDRENNNPGVPYERTHVIEQAWYAPPEVRIFEVSSAPLNEADAERGAKLAAASVTEETFFPRRRLLAHRPVKPNTDESVTVPVAGPLIVEVLFPTIAFSAASEASLYVQTSSGRAKAGAGGAGFDPQVPGTIKLDVSPCDPGRVMPPAGYLDVLVRGSVQAGAPLEEGRFSFQIPMELGPLQETSQIDWKPPETQDRAAIEEERPKLQLKGGDTVFLGFKYNDDQNQPKWLVRSVKLGSDVFLDVMDRRFREEVKGTYVGEKVYFRVAHLTQDLTDERNSVEIELAAASGQKRKLELTETFEHTGVFKGLASLTYAPEADAKDPTVLPVNYGDTVTVTYVPGPGQEPVQRTLDIYKGADGSVIPFTKRFKDPEIAVKTQFTIAEAYFEQAKKHRAINERDLAQEEIAAGKKILEEALRDHPDTQAKVQADYLLANLALEFAFEAKDEEASKKHYAEAIARFTDLVTTYGDSAYAPKAQFKKAQAFKHLGDIDKACEEFVKLSYRYPDNELIAETISELGQYFWKKGKELKDRTEAEADPVQREKLNLQAQEFYRTAAEVLLRLSERFPQHALAMGTKVLAAEAYMHATRHEEAIKTFREVFEDPTPDKELAPRAMYWCGRAYLEPGKTNSTINAYRVLKNLTWDYPESQWAKYARGMLVEEQFQRIDAAGGEQQ